MIFSNHTYLLLAVFLLCILIQYYRYRRIAKGNFNISGLLLIKILIRSFILLLLFILAKSYGQISKRQDVKLAKAVFIIKTTNHVNFKLSEDDKINIITKLPESKYKQVELLLYNVKNDRFFVFIPSTSVTTFNHLLKIERPVNVIPLKMEEPNLAKILISNRIELFELIDNRWDLSDSNQDNFDLLKLLDQENDLISPFLLQYLLILILILLTIDLGIKYRVLKI